jgi:mRNA interferase MazF
MSLKFHPSIGAVLRCDFDPGFRPPEMVKRRPVIVISPRLRRREGLCTVVPLSQTSPWTVMPYHCEVRPEPRLPPPYDCETHWVKADMVATVGFHRLSAWFIGKVSGARNYIYPMISEQELERVRNCVRHALGI